MCPYCVILFIIWAKAFLATWTKPTLVYLLLLGLAHWVARYQSGKALDVERSKRPKVSYESATEALESLRHWALWLVTAETTAMAAIGWLSKSDLEAGWSYWQRLYGGSAIVFFGASVFYIGWLLGGVPSIRQRLIRGKNEHHRLVENDIYTKTLFAGLARFRTLEYFASLSHYLGIAGLACFGGFFIVGMIAPKKLQGDEVAAAIKSLGKNIETTSPNMEPLSRAIEKLAASIAEASRKEPKQPTSTESK